MLYKTLEMPQITLNFKSVAGQNKHSLTIDSSEKIEKYIQPICELFDYENVKLIFNGKVLEHNKTFDDYGCKNDNTFIVMSRKKEIIPISTSSPQITPTVPNVSPVIQPSNQSILTPPVDDSVPETTTQSFWNTHTDPNDNVNSSHLYNVEQIHAAIMIYLPIILSNNSIIDEIKRNPNSSTRLLSTREHRSAIKEALKNANTIITSLQQNIPIHISVINHSQTNQTQLSTTQSVQQQTPSITSTITQIPIITNQQSNTALLQQMLLSMLAGTNVNQNNDEYYDNSEVDDNDNDETNSGGEQEQPTQQVNLTQTDKDNIKMLIDFTGANENDAKQAYLTSNKNLELASEILLRRM